MADARHFKRTSLPTLKPRCGISCAPWVAAARLLAGLAFRGFAPPAAWVAALLPGLGAAPLLPQGQGAPARPRARAQPATQAAYAFVVTPLPLPGGPGFHPHRDAGSHLAFGSKLLPSARRLPRPGAPGTGASAPDCRRRVAPRYARSCAPLRPVGSPPCAGVATPCPARYYCFNT